MPENSLGKQGSWFMVQSSGFKVQDLGFRVQGSGFSIQDLGFRVQELRFKIQNLNQLCRKMTLANMIQSSGFSGLAFGIQDSRYSFRTLHYA